MKLKTFAIIFGVFLILVQTLAFIGMNRSPVGLYPEMEDMWDANYFYQDNVPPGRKLCFAFNAGFDRFIASFSDIRFDFRNDYQIMSPTQIASAYYRYSLMYVDPAISLGFDYLKMYDIILTFSYYITGLVGLSLIIISPLIKK